MNLIKLFLENYKQLIEKTDFTNNHEEDVKRFILEEIPVIKELNNILNNEVICKYTDKEFDVQKTNIVIKKHNIKNGIYIIQNPYNKKAYVPPPDIFIIHIHENSIIDYLGIECKSSITDKPTFNDNLVKPFSKTNIIYWFSNIRKKYNCIFISEVVIDKYIIHKFEYMYNEIQEIIKKYVPSKKRNYLKFYPDFRKKNEIKRSFKNKIFRNILHKKTKNYLNRLIKEVSNKCNGISTNNNFNIII
jgi:hypothetical protein